MAGDPLRSGARGTIERLRISCMRGDVMRIKTNPGKGAVCLPAGFGIYFRIAFDYIAKRAGYSDQERHQ